MLEGLASRWELQHLPLTAALNIKQLCTEVSADTVT